MAENRVLAISTPTLLSLVGIPPTTLNYWISRGFCTPSLDTGAGNRSTRYWTVRDVLVIRAIKSLRDAGCSLQNIARVDMLLTEAWGAGLAETVLVYDGRDVLIEREKTLISLLTSHGQGVFAEVLTFVALPLHTWAVDAEKRGELVDVEEIRARRAGRRNQRGVA